MQAPNFEGPATASFSSAFASSLHNSQVGVSRRKLSALSRQAIEFCEPHGMRHKGAFSLAVTPDGRHGGLASDGFSVMLEFGHCSFAAYPGDLLVFDEQFCSGGVGSTWDGKSVIENVGPSRPVLVRRVDAHRYVAVTLPIRNPFTTAPASFGVEGGPRGGPYEWFELVPSERAVAAIGADFSIVAAFDNGKLRVYLPEADKPYDPKVPAVTPKPKLMAERDIGLLPRWLSLAHQHILLVNGNGSSSRLKVLKSDTTPLYSVGVDFEVLQPAIAGAGSRVYLAGKGIAALDDNRVVWTLKSEQPLYVSTFVDGSLAIATGNRLELVNVDGTIEQSFTTEEALVAPPAIAADGSVWLASETAFYVVR